MTLLSEFLAITAGWRSVFPQQRTFVRGVRQALGSLVCLGRRCLTRIIWTNGGQNSSWSAEYFLHSRCQWEPQQLFRPILKSALEYCPQRLVGVALDDTKLRKTGRAIQQAFYQRDPMSPPFHLNLVLGLRFLQASLLVPLHRDAPVGTRALPIRFQEVSRVKRPGKKASAAEMKQYKEAAKKQNLSRSFVEMGKHLRAELDQAGGDKKVLVLTGDGSFCNRTCFGEIPERSVLLARARKDAKLCFGAAAGSRRFYGTEKFTPEQIRKDDSREWKTSEIFYGGMWRTVRYKEVAEVFWQRGAGKRPLRLIVIAPTPYRKKQSNKFYYRDPAYLLTSDLHSPVKDLLQIYFDRWQIEVNHREEWAKRSYGTLPPFPNSLSWLWRLTARCSWLPFGPLAQSAAKPTPNSPSGEEVPGGLPVWISLPFSARKWRNNRSYSNLLASESPNRGSLALPLPEKM
jgi:hypothetical protein